MNAEVSLSEAIQLGATDSSFYSRFFFPRTVRQATPEMHVDVWRNLETPGQRYVGAEIYRDGAKTSLARLYTSKRIAYGISHVILYVSRAEKHAVRSVSWIARQVKFNTLWAQAFGLRPGGKWSEGEIEIIHGVEEYPIFLLAVGMTGQIRGVNFDDYRPDLIVADDVDDEETAGTEEQREKANSLFFGSLMNTLASPTEASDPRAVLLATPYHAGDILNTAKRDPQWKIVTYGCFDEQGRSRWEAKWPTEYLLKEKQSAAQRNQMSVWMREKECKLVSAELVSFKVEWLKPVEIVPAGAWWLIAVDPASSDAKDADDVSISLLAFYGKDVYLMDQFNERAAMPDRVVSVMFSWMSQYPVRTLVIETVGYQKVLKWYVEKEMMEQRKWLPVLPYDDKRSKGDRILQSILRVGPYGNLHARPCDGKFLSQYAVWYPGADMHDDALDSVSIGISAFYNKLSVIEGEYTVVDDSQSQIKALSFGDECP